MARLDTGSSSSGWSVRVPWKVVAVVAVIGVSWFFMYAQYRAYFPGRRPPTARMRVAPPASDLPRGTPREFSQLNLTDAQKKELSSLAEGTTNPGQMRRRAERVLTPEQKTQLEGIRKEAAAQRAEQAARLARRAQAAGLSAEQLQQRSQETRQATQERRANAGQASATPGAN